MMARNRALETQTPLGPYKQEALVLISDWFVCKTYVNNSTKIHETEERLANGNGIYIRKLAQIIKERDLF